MAKSKEQRILKILKSFDTDMDSKQGKILINDFLQIKNILEALKDTNQNAFFAFYALVEKNLELEVQLKERGKRIHILSKGQLQPKNTGSKSISTHKKRTS